MNNEFEELREAIDEAIEKGYLWYDYNLGWYWHDEGTLTHGPYDSSGEAYRDFKHYVEVYLQ